MVVIAERGTRFAGVLVGCQQYQWDIVQSDNQLVHCVGDMLKLLL